MPSRPATYAELFNGENRVIRIKSIDAAVLRRKTQFVVSLRHLRRPEDGCNIWSRAGYFKVRLLHLSCLYDAFRSWAFQSGNYSVDSEDEKDLQGEGKYRNHLCETGPFSLGRLNFHCSRPRQFLGNVIRQCMLALPRFSRGNTQ